MNKKLLLAVASALAVATLPACTTGQLVDIALQNDPEKAIRSMAKRRVNAYKYNPGLMVADFKRAQREYNRLIGKLEQASGAQWGKQEARTVPTRTRYVKYTEDYKNRVVVDFDQGSILVEHLEEDNVQEKLKNAVITALLTPADPRSVDLFSDKPVELNGTPYMRGLVADQNARLIESADDARGYAAYLVGNRLQTRTIDANGISKKVSFVQFAMINSHIEQRALKFAAHVRKYSEDTQVSRSLIYAVMKIESDFNPFAVSSAPAYGLMQLVPASGGREAYRKAKGINASPSKDYLFEAENNIELGSTYLGILMGDSALKGIDNPVSREYCAIAAYNTGPGNVLRAFGGSSKNQQAALDKINSLKPDQVFEQLRTRLPYQETRNYLVNVVSAKKRFATM